MPSTFQEAVLREQLIGKDIADFTEYRLSHKDIPLIVSVLNKIPSITTVLFSHNNIGSVHQAEADAETTATACGKSKDECALAATAARQEAQEALTALAGLIHVKLLDMSYTRLDQAAYEFIVATKRKDILLIALITPYEEEKERKKLSATIHTGFFKPLSSAPSSGGAAAGVVGTSSKPY